VSRALAGVDGSAREKEATGAGAPIVRKQQLEKEKGKGIDAEQTPALARTKDKSKKHTPEDDFSL
jgi:hypothetical protein